MIHVNRDRVPMPSVLEPDWDSPGRRELEEARRFYEQPESKRRGKPYRFEVYHADTVRKALTELFHGKCAFCESRLFSLDVYHFRPVNGIVDERGEYHPDLYWWLANEWTNLYSVCSQCNRMRPGQQKRFPIVDENQRAAGPGEEQNEQPLLLDPCADYPEEYLVFTETGEVASEKERGQITIALLDLNRRRLVDARREAAQQTKYMIEQMEVLAANLADDPGMWDLMAETIAGLRKFTQADQEYAGLRRQMVRSALGRLTLPIAPDVPSVEGLVESVTADWDALAPDLAVSKAQQRRAKSSYNVFQQSQAAYSLEEEGDEEKYFRQVRLIERIEIHNVKAIRDLQLDLTTSQSGRTPWMMLLGENGTGKSTILQAVALVLIGEKYFSKLVSEKGIRPSEYVRDRCKSGYVKVKLSGFPAPHMLTFRDGSVEFNSPLGETLTVRFDEIGVTSLAESAWMAQTLVLGYGATRLLPRRQVPETYGEDWARVDNLFDLFVPLVNARRWLLELSDDKFDYTKRTLKELLALTERDDLIRKDGRIWVKEGGVTFPLESLSDGCQAVLGLVSDILQIILGRWPTPEMGEGIVLLDEVGSHLHPMWKMRIVSSLRKFLPGMQFIVTTHQPLCLRGISDGEIVVMRRDAKRRVVGMTDLPSVEGLRVDQLLTSEHFGLASTRSLETEELFTEYYGLLAKKRLSQTEEKRLVELAAQLEELRMMGATRRERMMLEVIDEYLASEPGFLATPEEDRRKAALEQQLADILAE